MIEDLHRFDNRSGYILVSAVPVAMPVFRIHFTALVQNHKAIPPLEEFVMRSISAGLCIISEISNFLGIDERVTTGTVASLLSDECITYEARIGRRSNRFVMTSKGSQTLRDCERISPENGTFTVDYDGILRRLVRFGKGELLKPKDIKDSSLIELPPFPPAGPKVEDLRLNEVDRYLREASRRRPGKPIKNDFLAIKAIDKRERFFVPSTALVFKSQVGEDVQVAFLIDGKISKDHEEAFSRSGGPRKLGIGVLIKTNPALQFAEEIIGQGVLSELGVTAEIQNLEQGIIGARGELEAAEYAVKTARNKDTLASAEAWRNAAAEKLSSTTKSLDRFPVRMLGVYDHKPLLWEALETCNSRLMIISPWITDEGSGEAFTSRLRKCLEKGVTVYLGHGIEKIRKKKESSSKTNQHLEALAQEFGNFTFTRLGDVHAKMLICDSSWFVLTSFNWLSFMGDPGKTFRDERGLKVSFPGLVDKVFNEMLLRFTTS